MAGTGEVRGALTWECLPLGVLVPPLCRSAVSTALPRLGASLTSSGQCRALHVLWDLLVLSQVGFCPQHSSTFHPDTCAPRSPASGVRMAEPTQVHYWPFRLLSWNPVWVLS